jgi:Spy/CpxP family protein refolding chaperone
MRRFMMNGKGKTLLLIISLAFNLGACLAVAVQVRGDRGTDRHDDDRKRHRKHLSDKLNLSPEQEEIVAASREQLFEALRGMKGRLHEESDALAELLTADEVDSKAISEQVARVAAVRNEMQERLVDHLVDVRKVLEPDQRELFREFAGKVLSPPWRGRHQSEKSPNGESPKGE